VEYNWQKQRESANPAETFGRTPDETMTVPAYRRYMIDKIRRYHTSYLGWISNYDASDPEVLAGAAEIQRTFGYRFVLEVAIPLTDQWQEHTVEFEIRTAFADETTLRFSLPRAATGTFDLAEARLKLVK
jgi:hypothetical protein